jgi:regulator of protease activity HflC (stomatin/prohibitin superfamily)
MSDSRHPDEPAGPWAQSIQAAFRSIFLGVCALAIGWGFSNIKRIPPESRAVVLRFGEISRVRGAGLLPAWPHPIERVVLIPSQDQLLSLDIVRFATSGSSISSSARDNAGFLLTGGGGVVRFDATIFYRITDPVAYLLSESHVEPALDRLFVASAVAICAGRDLDAILVASPERTDAELADARAKRERLRGELLDALNRRLAALAADGASLGVEASRVDLTASLPAAAKSAFDRVLLVTQQAEQDIALARTEAERIRQTANQQRDRIQTDATALANERLAEATSRTAAISALAQRSPGLSDQALASKLYYDRVETLLRKAKEVTTVDAPGNVNLLLSGQKP